MSPEKQRIAIAEACGWKNTEHPDVMRLTNGWTMPEKWCMDPAGKLRFNHDRPDYLNDLNAMHEAEKVLTDAQYEFYALYLGPLTTTRRRQYISATAAQRAEAFLRTLNRWEE